MSAGGLRLSGVRADLQCEVAKRGQRSQRRDKLADVAKVLQCHVCRPNGPALTSVGYADLAEPVKVVARTVQRTLKPRYYASAFNTLLCDRSRRASRPGRITGREIGRQLHRREVRESKGEAGLRGHFLDHGCLGPDSA